MAHWGGGLPFYGLMKKEGPEVLRRVYFDTAASPYLYRPRDLPPGRRNGGAGEDPLRQRLSLVPGQPLFERDRGGRATGRVAGDDFRGKFGEVAGL